MSNSVDTRIWRGSVLSVRNADDTAWIAFSKCISHSMPGVAASQIPGSTAASQVDEFRLGLQENGQATFNVFDNMDDTFLIAMNEMQDAGSTRKFKLTMPEGVNKVRYFTGYVVDQPITGNYNQLWTMTLTLEVVEDSWWVSVLTGASLAPTSGSIAGGTTVTVTGTGFSQGFTDVTIAGVARPVNVISSTSLTFVTPAHDAGNVPVVVRNGGDNVTVVGGFTYS